MPLFGTIYFVFLLIQLISVAKHSGYPYAELHFNNQLVSGLSEQVVHYSQA